MARCTGLVGDRDLHTPLNPGADRTSRAPRPQGLVHLIYGIDCGQC